VANKIINGKQCSIAWHVDNAIATHVDQAVLNELGQQMMTNFGDMKITSGTEHEFLGMKIRINEKDKTVEIDMKDQIREMIEKFETETGEKVGSLVTTPATHNLYKVNLYSMELEKKKSDLFHLCTASLLFIMKRVRPDIKPVYLF
jgi:hypothetical protein